MGETAIKTFYVKKDLAAGPSYAGKDVELVHMCGLLSSKNDKTVLEVSIPCPIFLALIQLSQVFSS